MVAQRPKGRNRPPAFDDDEMVESPQKRIRILFGAQNSRNGVRAIGKATKEGLLGVDIRNLGEESVKPHPVPTPRRRSIAGADVHAGPLVLFFVLEIRFRFPFV
jgi:hypothetical protein